MLEEKDSKLLHLIYEQITGIKSEVTGMKSEITGIKSEITEIKQDVVGIKETLDTHTISIMNIEETLKFYGDMFQVNKDAILETNKRVSKLEKLNKSH